MSINRRYLPQVETLKEEFKKHGDDEFYRKYVRKIDTFIGSPESIDYIDEFSERYFKSKQNQ